MTRRGRKSNYYDETTVSRSASKEHRDPAEALARLRAENRQSQGRPYRAESLAEAEQVAGFGDASATPAGILRANALTGKHRGVSQPRRTRD